MIPISACGNQPPKVELLRTPEDAGANRRLYQVANGAKLAGTASHYNLFMRLATTLFFLLISFLSFAQNPSAAPAQHARFSTVPITLDHDRIVIDVYLSLPDGTSKRIRGWVDNGNSELTMSRRAATLLGLSVTCGEKECSAPPPPAITIGEMKIPLASVKQVKIPLKAADAATVMAAGMSAEINIPATILRNYDVLVDYPQREFTLGEPGSIKFKGVSAKAMVGRENGLMEIPSQINNKKYNLELDLGSSISFLAQDLFEKLAVAHAGWPQMVGAVGPANMWGTADEAGWKLMRVDRVQFGPLYLTDVPFVDVSADMIAKLEKTSGMATVGLLGAQALLNYRVGLDYAHSTVYFDIGSTFRFPDFDVVGLILRPEDDTRFTIVGVADFEGKPSVSEVQPGDRLLAVDGVPTPDSTMGQVWSALEGSPGQERRLTIERGGKHFVVVARVCHFLGESQQDQVKKKAE